MDTKARAIQKQAILEVLQEQIKDQNVDLKNLALNLEQEAFQSSDNTVSDHYKNKISSLKLRLKGERGTMLRKILIDNTIHPKELMQMDLKLMTDGHIQDYLQQRDSNKEVEPEETPIFHPIESPKQFGYQVVGHQAEYRDDDFEDQLNKDYTQEVREAQNNTDFVEDESNFVQRLNQADSPRFDPLPEQDTINKQFIEEEQDQICSNILEESPNNKNANELLKQENLELKAQLQAYEQQIQTLKTLHEGQIQNLNKQHQAQIELMNSQISYYKQLSQNQDNQVMLNFQQRQSVLNDILAQISKNIKQSDNFGQNLQIFKNLLGQIPSQTQEEQKLAQINEKEESDSESKQLEQSQHSLKQQPSHSELSNQNYIPEQETRIKQVKSNPRQIKNAQNIPGSLFD